MLKYALIGTGRISANHLLAVKALADEIELAAVCDIVPDNMDRALAKAGIAGPVKKYTDYRALIDEAKPDIVAIATDSGTHAEIGHHCLSHGVHCIMEKPIALSISEADGLISAAEKSGKLLAVCHQNRFNKGILKIREALDGGRFGKLSHVAAHVRWNRTEEYYRQAAWRGKWADDGGCLISQCIHSVDLMCWMLGDIEEVFAYADNAHHPYIEVEDIGLAVVKAKSGTLGLFEGTVNVFPKNLEETLYLFGDRGTAKAGGASVNIIEEWRFADGLDDPEAVMDDCRESPPNVYGFGHQKIYRNALDAIRSAGNLLVDGHEGKRALELILAMYKSKKTGLPVRLPLGDFATTDMEGTF